MYGKHAKDPKNFCPYFWGTIMLGIFLVPPMYIIGLPVMLLSKLFTPSDPIEARDEGLFSPFIFMSLLLDLCLAMIICMIGMWFQSFGKELSIIQSIGFIGWLLLVVGIIAWLKITWDDKRRDRKYKRMMADRAAGKYDSRGEKKPNVFWEGIKAWYKKNCPIIDWK